MAPSAVPARLLLVLVALGTGCQLSSSPSSNRTSAAPEPRTATAPVLRPPETAILTDDEAGLPRTGGRDHLSLTEAARDQPDQVLALELYRGWSWADASTREWSAGDRRLEVIVLLTLRRSGAERAYARWSQDAAAAPLAAGGCRPSMTRVERCRLGRAGPRAVMVAQIDAAVFRVAGLNVNVEDLGELQAERLTAG